MVPRRSVAIATTPGTGALPDTTARGPHRRRLRSAAHDLSPFTRLSPAVGRRLEGSVPDLPGGMKPRTVCQRADRRTRYGAPASAQRPDTEGSGRRQRYTSRLCAIRMITVPAPRRSLVLGTADSGSRRRAASTRPLASQATTLGFRHGSCSSRRIQPSRMPLVGAINRCQVALRTVGQDDAVGPAQASMPRGPALHPRWQLLGQLSSSARPGEK